MEAQANEQGQFNKLLEYEPNAINDTLLLAWWTRMVQSGDIKTFLTEDALALSNFINHFRPPMRLLYKVNADIGIWFAAVISPLFDGAFFDMWIDQGHRAGKAWLEAMEEALEVAFDQYPVLIGTTTQANLIDGHLRLGYNIGGMIPKLWNGKDVHVLYITRESFNMRQTHLVRRAS